MIVEEAGTIEINDKALDKLIKAFSGQLPTIRVGVLGNKTQRTVASGTQIQGEVKTNAAIGAIHEFGLGGMPERSFLRMPLAFRLSNYLAAAGAFDDGALKKVISDRSIMAWAKKVAVTAEAVIADAFDSGGFGVWQPSDFSRKKNHQTLVETQQLRNSITSEVKE